MTAVASGACLDGPHHPCMYGDALSPEVAREAYPRPAAALMADPAVAATARLAERAAVFFRRCRECGSERYKQRSIWSWTDDPGC